MISRLKAKYSYGDDVWDAVEGVLSGVLQSVLSGILLYLSFPPVGWWPLAWVALVPAMAAHYRTFPDEASWMAVPTATVTFLSLHFSRVSVGFPLGAEGFHPLLKILLRNKFSILSSMFAVVGLASAFARSFQKRTGWRWTTLEPVLFWIALDHLRDSVPVMGASASFAYSQFKVPFLVRVSALVGALGLSGTIVAVNAALTAIVFAYFRDDRGYQWPGRAPPGIRRSMLVQAKLTFAAAAIVVLSGALAGCAGLSWSSHVTVGLVQPGRTMAFEGDSGLAAIRDLTVQASLLGAKIVVWPEASFRDDPRKQDIWAGIQDIARESGCYLVVPYFTEAPGFGAGPAEVPAYINEGLFVSPSGEVLGAGAKDHPVTLLGETSVTRGKYPVFDTPWGKVGIMICYDLNFTDTARRLALNGAQLICVPSNDWKAVSQAQYIYAVFRASENGVSVIKADTSYDSCIVRPDGIIAAKSLSWSGSETVLVANVPLRSGSAPAVRVSPFLGSAGLAGWLGLTAWTIWASVSDQRRSKLPAKPEGMDGNVH